MTSRFLPAVFAFIALYFGAMPASCAAPERPSAKVFFQYNKFRGAELSPDGQYLAALVARSDTRQLLAVIHLPTRKTKILAHYNHMDVGSFQWRAKHFEAGFKQWGLAMQNDIADGTRWAIAQGIADARRICIAGASYGGYAALMGVVNDPDLYQCAVEWAGVTDINLMYSGVWEKKSDTTESFARYGMPKMIGDQTRDAAQLKATSPIEQAARIQKPLLLAYGGKDKRVPLEHGQRFYDVVRKTNKKVEWVLYKTEGHGWSDEDTSRDFWWKVQNFLEVNIGQK